MKFGSASHHRGALHLERIAKTVLGDGVQVPVRRHTLFLSQIPPAGDRPRRFAAITCRWILRDRGRDALRILAPQSVFGGLQTPVRRGALADTRQARHAALRPIHLRRLDRVPGLVEQLELENPKVPEDPSGSLVARRNKTIKENSMESALIG